MVAPLIGIIGARLGAAAAVRGGAAAGGMAESFGAAAGRHGAISLSQNIQDRINRKEEPEQQ